MNLELIRKYEKEFLHMLHGGKVLMGKKDPITNTTKWYPSVLNPFVETSDTIVVVIDDMYSPYRKALAEGKTIQYMNSNGEVKSLDEWDNIGWKQFKGYVENYRIKPEEPKFKAGDWVTHIEAEKPWQITDNSLKHLDNRDLVKWEPKEGEICIFWDDSSKDAEISKFNRMCNGKYVNTQEQYYWDNCMPFTGVLPPHMKD